MLLRQLMLCRRELHRQIVQNQIKTAQSTLTAVEIVVDQGKAVNDTALEAIIRVLECVTDSLKTELKYRRDVSPLEAARIKNWWDGRVRANQRQTDKLVR